MKYFYSILFMLGVLSSTIAQKIGANLSYCIFSTPEKGPYMEIYLTIAGNSITYITKEDKKSAAVEVLLLLKKDTTIIQFDKYVLHSPEITDTQKATLNLIDQKRFSAANGTYNLEVSLTDAYQPENKANASIPVVIDYPSDKIVLSDIQLVESYQKTITENTFSKNGFDFTPYTIDFYPTAVSKLVFYAEVYNTLKILGEEELLFNYSIKKSNSNEVVNNLSRFTKQKAKIVNILFAELDIRDLPSGNYDLTLEVKNKKNDLLAEKKLFFQRSNKNAAAAIANLDLVEINHTFVQAFPKEELIYNLKSIYPIATESERTYLNNLLKSDDIQLQQKFFLNFWTKRNNNDPHQAWLAYLKEVKKVDGAYSTQIEHGFETDRGRVYLQYGAPNDILRAPREPGTLPYEIWQYYTLSDNQRDAKFVFYNPDLVTNDYVLIHSDARGEINDPRWKLKVNNSFKELNGSKNLDKTSYRNTYGSRINDFDNGIQPNNGGAIDE